MPEVTVVLHVQEELANLTETLRGLTAQEGAPSFEVLIILNTSSTDVRTTARQLCDQYALAVRIVEEPRREMWRVRNRAIDECRTRWIAFSSDDAVPERSWLAVLSRTAKASEARQVPVVMYDMALFDSGYRFEPESDGTDTLAEAIRRASHVPGDETATLRHEWGGIAVKLGRFDEARAIFDSLGDHPKYGPNATLYSGDFALRDRLWLAAEQRYQRCLELRPEWDVPVERLTTLLIQRADATVNVQKKVALQREALSRLQGIACPSELQTYQQASLEAAIGSRDLARGLFAGLTAQSSFQAGAWFHLGEIALATHDSASAAAAFQRCLDVQPAHRKAISRLTSLLLDTRVGSAI